MKNYRLNVCFDIQAYDILEIKDSNIYPNLFSSVYYKLSSTYLYSVVSSILESCFHSIVTQNIERPFTQINHIFYIFQ